MAKKNVRPKTERAEATATAMKKPPLFDLSAVLPLVNLRWQAALLFVLTYAFYGNTLQHGYALDDDVVYVRNSYVQAGISGIPDLLTKDSFHGHLNKQANFLPGGRYRPMSLITYAFEQDFWGDKPHLSHQLNVFLYALSIVFLLLLLRRYLFPDKPALAFIAALLYAIHPLHTEVVANIKGRDEILAMLFLPLTLMALFHYVKENRKTWVQVVGAILFFLALMSKENCVMFAFLIPLTLYYFTNESLKRIVMLTAPYWGVMLIYLILRTYATEGTGILKVAYEDDMTNPYMRADFAEAWATKFYVLLKYIGALFFPLKMSWDYSFAAIPYITFANPLFWLAILVNGGLFVLGLLQFKRRTALSYGILYYFITLSLVSNLVISLGGAPYGERFMYQPSLGFAIAVAALLYYLFDQKHWSTLPTRRTALIALLAVTTTLAAVRTIARNRDWKDSVTIALADVHNAPGSAKTNFSAGDAEYRQAFESADVRDKPPHFYQAIEYYQNVLDITPGWRHAARRVSESFYEMAKISDSLNTVGNPGLAGELFTKIKAANPVQRTISLLDSTIAYDSTRHNAWSNLGHMRKMLGDTAAASVAYRRALHFRSDTAAYWYNVGELYYQQKNYKEAIRHFTEAERLSPNYVSYVVDLGVVLFNDKRYAEARRKFERALQLDPNNQTARVGLSETQRLAPGNGLP